MNEPRFVKSPLVIKLVGDVRTPPAGESIQLRPLVICVDVPVEQFVAMAFVVPLPPDTTVAVLASCTVPSLKRTSYVPGNNGPNEYVPSAAVVAVTG